MSGENSKGELQTQIATENIVYGIIKLCFANASLLVKHLAHIKYEPVIGECDWHLNNYLVNKEITVVLGINWSCGFFWVRHAQI